MQHRPTVDLVELESQSAALLPSRDTLCSFACVTVAPVVGVNLALALNAATINSSATALAGQFLTLHLP